jgi:hypothetical protein
MHGAGRFGLASLRNLDQLPATGAVVIAAPLKIVNGSGSPLRVLALVEELAGSTSHVRRYFSRHSYDRIERDPSGRSNSGRK